MENIDKTINEMLHKKLMTLIQDNVRRIKNINIRYTSRNKKNSLECVEAGHESYNRLLKGLSRDLVSIEKKVREKFVEPYNEERKTALLSYINTEAGLILKNIEEKFKGEYKKLGKEEIFIKNFADSHKQFNENLDKYAAKFLVPPSEFSTRESKYKPVELSEIYGIDKNFIVEINLIAPLQKISSVFEGLNETPETQRHYGVIKDFIREMFKDPQGLPGEITETVEARKARKRYVARESILISELALNLQLLAEPLAVPYDKRNKAILEKIWERFQKALNKNKDGEKYLSGLRKFYEFVQNYDG